MSRSAGWIRRPWWCPGSARWPRPRWSRWRARRSGGPNPTPGSFEQIFECEPAAEYHGFSCWDDFFTRRFRAGVRLVSAPADDSVIVNACESTPLQVRKEVSRSDQFWLKGQPYSLDNMLDFDDLAPRFEGGTVYQAFLSALSYHRWHSPVSGTIRKVRIVNGTYYLENQFEGFADPQGRIPAPQQFPSRSSPRWRPGHSSSSRPTTPKSA